MELEMFTLALHQNYVKKIIRLFNLKPEDFDTTPSKFCNVFDHCQFIIENTTSEPVEEFSADSTAFPMRFTAKYGDEYWLGLHNFYVIGRYNPRTKYAMAVYQLSEIIRNRRCESAEGC